MKYYMITLRDGKVYDVNSFAETEYEDFLNTVENFSRLIEENKNSRWDGYTIQSIYC